ncbi:hypothetical protein TCAL_14809 [Tigriopus californicus]|uniref:Saposin B-type domain-containing protein n=1 Tax=Tigriopus californicus TaxID=6832 RepID=A0A553PR23_TIGCA|nr:hypothetical protein TCAL_14809 [Tigriopus californicus]
MKFLSLITVVALAVSVSGDCSTCEDGVNAIMQSMSTSNDITGAVVKDACCPSQDDPESCNTAVDTWWPAISAAMAASENMAPITCAVLDCGDAAKAWDCDTSFCEDASVSPDATVCGDYVEAILPCATDALVAKARASLSYYAIPCFKFVKTLNN